MKFLTWFIESFLVARLLSVGPAKSVCWTKRLPQIIYLGWESTSLRQRWRIDACFHCMPIKYRWKKSIKTIYNGRGNSKLLYILNAVAENTRGQRVFQEQSMKEADNWFLEENSLFGLGGLGHRLIALLEEVFVFMTEIRNYKLKMTKEMDPRRRHLYILYPLHLCFFFFNSNCKLLLH